MKKVFIVFLVYLVNTLTIHAQSKTIESERRENPLNALTRKVLPDLAFLLPPVLTGPDNGYILHTQIGRYTADFPMQFSVVNWGKVTSKRRVMYA